MQSEAWVVRFITNGCILLSRTAPVKQKKHSLLACMSAARQKAPQQEALQQFVTSAARSLVRIFLSHYVAGLARIISPRTKSIMLKANNSSSVHLTQFFWQAAGAFTYAKNTLFEVQICCRLKKTALTRREFKGAAVKMHWAELVFRTRRFKVWLIYLSSNVSNTSRLDAEIYTPL